METNELKLILANGGEISIAAYMIPLGIVVQCDDLAGANTLIGVLTPDNLALATITDGDEILAQYRNAYATDINLALNQSGSVTARVWLKGVKVRNPSLPT